MISHTSIVNLFNKWMFLMYKADKKILLFILIIAGVFLFISCSDATTTSSSSIDNATNTNSTEYRIKFFLNDEQVSSLGLSDLHNLPEVTLTIAGTHSDETGPTLSSVLKLAGIQNYNKVTIKGMLKGRIATGELTLNKSEVTDNVMFDFNNQGKTKLCGTNIPEANWIIDVSEIYIEL